MKKRVKGRGLSRPKDQRDALLKTMLVSLVRYGRITTTLAKAKTLRPFAERLVSHAKVAVLVPQKNIAKQRLLAGKLPVPTVQQLIKIAALMKDRTGGYTRIVKLGARKSDASPRAMIEWVEQVPQTPKAKKTDKKSEKKGKQDAKKKESPKEEEKKEAPKQA